MVELHGSWRDGFVSCNESSFFGLYCGESTTPLLCAYGVLDEVSVACLYVYYDECRGSGGLGRF